MPVAAMWLRRRIQSKEEYTVILAIHNMISIEDKEWSLFYCAFDFCRFDSFICDLWCNLKSKIQDMYLVSSYFYADNYYNPDPGAFPLWKLMFVVLYLWVLWLLCCCGASAGCCSIVHTVPLTVPISNIINNDDVVLFVVLYLLW